MKITYFSRTLRVISLSVVNRWKFSISLCPGYKSSHSANANIQPPPLQFFACNIARLASTKPKKLRRGQNILLSHIAFTKYWIRIQRPSWLNAFCFASLPDAGKPKWNCKMRASFGIVLQYRPKCFSPEVLKKQYCKKNYQTQFKCSVNNSGLL